MSWNSASVLALVAAVFAIGGARPAYAGAPPRCAPLAVVVDPSVREQWPELQAMIRETFHSRADVDTCARIEVTPVGAGLGLTVVLPDKRIASRSVSRAEDVLPALEGLLLLPERARDDHTTETTTSPPPERREPEARPASSPAVVRLATPPAPVDPATPFRLELDLSADARTGDGWVGGGGGVAGFADIAHWLLGFQGRIDGYHAADTGGHGMALELIALGGHRFALGPNRTLDLTVGPALALHAAAPVTARASAQMPPQMNAPNVSKIDGNDRLARLILGCRLTFGAQSLLRTFVQVDADIGERNPVSGSTPDGAGLPAWTVGLAVGAAVGTR